jgi:hypothetical protein
MPIDGLRQEAVPAESDRVERTGLTALLHKDPTGGDGPLAGGMRGGKGDRPGQGDAARQCRGTGIRMSYRSRFPGWAGKLDQLPQPRPSRLQLKDRRQWLIERLVE